MQIVIPQSFHAIVMVQGGVDAVDANGVDTKLLEVRDVASTVGSGGQGIDEACGLAECADGAGT
jgi:hypothetical protein